MSREPRAGNSWNVLSRLRDEVSVSPLIRLACCVAVAAACYVQEPETGDLGSFFGMDTAPVPDTVASDLTQEARWGSCYAPGKAETELSVVGQLFEMSFENLFPGTYVGNVAVKVFDACGVQVHAFEVGPIGSFATHFPVGEGFNGYFEYPYKPDWVAAEDYRLADFPLFREFDKDFVGVYIHVNLRMFSPSIIDIPLAFMEQKPDLGYLQGTVYEWITYDTIVGAKIKASSGKVCYIGESHLPDLNLTQTCSRGLFLVANVTPGPVTLTVTLPGGKQVSKTVFAWPLESEPNRVITNVGIAVHPSALP